MKLCSSGQVSKLSVLVKEKGRDTIVYVISVFSFYIAGFISWYPANTERTVPCFPQKIVGIL